MTDSLAFIAAELEKSNLERQSLEERVSDLALRLDTIGWEPALGWDDDGGMTLEALKQTSRTLTDMVATAPLMKRAAELRHGYVFGQGVSFENAEAPRYQDIMDEPYNKAALFSMPAREELMKTRLTDGNLFVLRSKDTKPKFYRIPLSEISGVLTDPQSSERVWALQRTWTERNGTDPDGTTKTKWFYTSTYSGTRKQKIGDHSVDSKFDMIFMPFNRQVGFTFGVPDGYPAITWAIAYAEYLKNNSKLVKAYAQIAWKASTKTQQGGANVAAQITSPGTAGTASMGPQTDLTPMPRAGSDVSFENGRPLASMVAAALGVSVVALTADPGAAGSSYGSAQTLDTPTIIVMSTIQEGWKAFYEEVFRSLSARGKPITIKFPQIENDPIYRQLQSLGLAYAQGGLTQKEFREKVVELLSIQNPDEGLPEPDNFNNAHLTPEEAAKNAVALKVQSTGDPTARQGNSGATGGDKGQTNHDGDTDSFGNE